MDVILFLIDFILHVDRYLGEIIRNFGGWTYFILFMIVFSETGFVVTPFLPGDSLLFVVGTFGALGDLNFELSMFLLIIAAISGNTVNYFVGRFIGDKIMGMKNNRIIKKEYIEKTQAFYDRHGGKAIIFSRFIPIIRTFAPFVAGLGKMSVGRFFFYNFFGGISWVLLFGYAGYFFGNIPTVRNNFTYVIFAIIAISFLPTLIPLIRNKLRK